MNKQVFSETAPEGRGICPRGIRRMRMQASAPGSLLRVNKPPADAHDRKRLILLLRSKCGRRSVNVKTKKVLSFTIIKYFL